MARSHLGLLEEAKGDLLAAAKAEPNNKDVRRELQVRFSECDVCGFVLLELTLRRFVFDESSLNTPEKQNKNRR